MDVNMDLVLLRQPASHLRLLCMGKPRMGLILGIRGHPVPQSDIADDDLAAFVDIRIGMVRMT
jgi:hypothetical protein